MFVTYISYIPLAVCIAWLALAILALLRYFEAPRIMRISWKLLIISAVVLHLAYASLLTWMQYQVWVVPGNEAGHSFLAAALPVETPLPSLFEWTRSMLDRPLGYFAFYSFTRFFLGPLILVALTLAFTVFLRWRARYHPTNFKTGDIAAIALAALIAGWPGVVVLLPLGFLVAVVISLWMRFVRGVERVLLPPAFLIAAPIALVLGIPILKFFHLYTLVIT